MGNCRPVKTVFFDRDGTINVKPSEGQWVLKWEEFEFLPHVFEAMRYVKGMGYTTILVTNQRCVAKGLIADEGLNAIHQKMQESLTREGCQFDHIFYCPHDKFDGCQCRKPKPGLLKRAEAFYTVDKERSFMVGDSEVDILAGRSYGIKTIRLGTVDPLADFSISDLSELPSIVI